MPSRATLYELLVPSLDKEERRAAIFTARIDTLSTPTCPLSISGVDLWATRIYYARYEIVLVIEKIKLINRYIRLTIIYY